jgi:DNA-binding LacI/PurR family transcriptional regulator
MSKITLEDIARDAGYAVSTVSRVLNGSTKISTETKNKVFESASRLEYPIQKKVNGHSGTEVLNIGLVISGFHKGEFYSSFYKGFTEAAEQNNIMLSMVCIDRPKIPFLRMINRLSKLNDGLILFTPEFDRGDYLQLLENLPASYPIVSNGVIENPVFSTITFDSYSGGYITAKYFHEKGYKTFGMIKGPLDKAESRYRYNGFNDFISQTPTMQLSWEFLGDFSFDSGSSAFEAFLDLKEKPRAIFACNDAMCHAFMEAATKEGYRFPEDIAIIGFDDLPICRHHQPTISSISTPYEKLGQQTLDTIKNTILNEKAQNGMLSLLPVSLIERESS